MNCKREFTKRIINEINMYLFISFFFFINHVISTDCYSNGITSFDNLSSECQNNVESNTYYIQNDFNFGVSEKTLGTVIFQNTISITTGYNYSNNDYDWSDSYNSIYSINSYITFNGYWHSFTKSYLEQNCHIDIGTNGRLSFAGELSFHSFHFRRNFPPIVFWQGTYLHLNYQYEDRIDFYITTNGKTNECFDVFSLNSIENLKNQQNTGVITGEELPYTMSSGTLDKLSNDKLLRFCPSGKLASCLFTGQDIACLF